VTFRRRAVVFIDGVAHEVTIPRATDAYASDIDNAGNVVGRYTARNGEVQDLGTLGQAIRSSSASGINDRGQMGGAVLTGSGGFFYEPGKGVRSLNDLIDTSTGWNIVYA
jgi:hypothetical protein